jgi:hypothetical protein
VALALKAVSRALAVLSIIFIGLHMTQNNLHILFLAVGLETLSIAFIIPE